MKIEVDCRVQSTEEGGALVTAFLFTMKTVETLSSMLVSLKVVLDDLCSPPVNTAGEQASSSHERIDWQVSTDWLLHCRAKERSLPA